MASAGHFRRGRENDRLASNGISARAPRSYAPIPSTPSAVGRGITTMAPNSQYIALAQIAPATGLLSAVGGVVRVDDEALIDPATAVAGSAGPAHAFDLHPVPRQGGGTSSVGLPAVIFYAAGARHRRGGRENSCGSADLPAETLRRNVTSPKGTTQAALDILMAEEWLRAPDDKSHWCCNATLARVGKLTPLACSAKLGS